jgi:cell wall-associated NlpC family hydrolase
MLETTCTVGNKCLLRMVFWLQTSALRDSLRPMTPLACRTALAAMLMLAAASARAQAADPLSQWLHSRGEAPAATADAAPPVSPRSRLTEMAVAAMDFVGVPYRRGGNDAESGFDCSGFTRHLFQINLGLSLPRRSHEQAAAQGLADVPRTDLQPGDLVFFNTLKRAFSHVGIYVGDGRFIHSPRPGAAVRLESMTSSYWQRRFDGARRVAALSDASASTVALSAPAGRPHAVPDLPDFNR